MSRATLTVLAAATLVSAIILVRPDTFATIDDIDAAEASYFAKHGTYYQVLDGNKTPPREQEDVLMALGKNLPEGMRIDTYVRPDGKEGYTIRYQSPDGLYVISNDPEEFNSFEAKSTALPTSTPI